MFTPAWSNISTSSSGSFTFVPAKLHKLLKLMRLKLQFHIIIKLKYIKILFGHHLVIQQNLCVVPISCAGSVDVVSALVWRILQEYTPDQRTNINKG